MGNILTEVILTAKEELDQALNKANNVIPQLIDDIDKKLEETKELVDGAGAASKQEVEEVASQLEDTKTEVDTKVNKVEVETNYAKKADLSSKANISYVDTKVGQIVSGSPKGVFNNLDELISSLPTGDTGVYILKDTGDWYFWNSQEWERGGGYQGISLGENSVKPNMLENGVNFLNLYQYPNTCVEGYYINNVGEIVQGSNGAYAKIPVKALTTYSYWRQDGMYETSKGWTLFLNNEDEVIGKIDGNINIGGKYLGVNYVTFETPVNCTNVCFNVKINYFDSKLTAIAVEGDNLNFADGISKIFNRKLIDLETNENLNSLLKSFKSLGTNIYNYESDFVKDRYIDTNGNISSSTGWGMARIKVKENTKYSLYLPSGIYGRGIGSLGFYHDTELLNFLIPVSDYANGIYKGVQYVTFETPSNCNFVYFTCKRISEPYIFDDSQSLLFFEGEVINDDIANNYLTEINGYKIKISDSATHSLKGVKVTFVGDSLTEKNRRATINYCDYIQELTGIIVNNMGVSGTGYKKGEESSNAFYQRILNTPLDTDIVTIFGSGNDLSLPLGNADDNSTDTILGCVNKTIENLYSILPSVKLGIISPTPWINYPNYSEGNKMQLLSEGLKEICRKGSIPFLDLYNGSNLRPWDETFRNLMYSRDEGNGVHPDENGHKRIYPKVLKFIESL